MNRQENKKPIKNIRMTAVQKGDGYYEDVYYTNGRSLSSGVVYLNGIGDFTNAAIQKLGELEDIEEELGIDLDILFKALKQGIYTTVYKTYVFGNELTIDVRKQGFSFKEYGCDIVAYFKDYGKTWALSKEELE